MTQDVYSDDQILSFVNHLGRVDLDVMGRSEFLKNYSESKRAELLRGLADYDYEANDSSFNQVNMFIKRENYLAGSMDIDPDVSRKSPRGIQSVTPFVQYALGRFFRVFNSWLKDSCPPPSDDGVDGYVKHFTVASGLSCEEMGRFATYTETWADPRRWEADCEKYDSSITVRLLGVEYRICTLVGMSRHLRKMFRAQYTTRGKTRSGIRYRVVGTRNSGRPDTFCGNTVILMFLLWVYMPVCRWIAMVGGDDLVLCVDGPVDLTGVWEGLRRAGLKPKPMFRDRLCDLTFYSRLFWPTKDGHVLGPKIGRVLAKQGFRVNDLPPALYDAWRRGVLLGLEKDVNFIPILRELVHGCLLLVGEGRVLPDRDDKHRPHATDFHEATEETLSFAFERYGMRCDLDIQFELPLVLPRWYQAFVEIDM